VDFIFIKSKEIINSAIEKNNEELIKEIIIEKTLNI